MDNSGETIAPYAARYGHFLNEIEADLNELSETGVISRARTLSRRTGQHFNHNEYPMYFTGDLDSPFVLVHLNPKQADNPADRFSGNHSFGDLDDYFAAHRHFGAIRYGPASPRTHKSAFDHKQVRFLRPFRVIDFVDGQGGEDRFVNLERAIDHKLQLELIPYGSDAFSVRGFTEEVLRPHYERIMEVIAARPRRYVIFCGSVFAPLFEGYITDEHKFRLRKADSTREKQASRFANLALPYGGRTIAAGLAHSYPRMGIPMASYAEEIVNRYGRGPS